jgi:hypothetical protein
MFCYSLLNSYREQYIESLEGYTYVPLKIDDIIKHQTLRFAEETEMLKWT